MKDKLSKALWIVLIAAATWYAYPQGQAKQQGLRLSIPVESPDGVTFLWTGGAQDSQHTLFRKLRDGITWERIQINLPGSGTYFAPGFTLDRDWEYKIQAEAQ